MKFLNFTRQFNYIHKLEHSNHSFLIDVCRGKWNIDLLDYPEVESNETAQSILSLKSEFAGILGSNFNQRKIINFYENEIFDNVDKMKYCKIAEAFTFDICGSLARFIPQYVTYEIINKYGTEEMKNKVLSRLRTDDLRGIPVHTTKSKVGLHGVFYGNLMEKMCFLSLPHFDVHDKKSVDATVPSLILHDSLNFESENSPLEGIEKYSFHLNHRDLLANQNELFFDSANNNEVMIQSQLLDNLSISALCLGLQKEILSFVWDFSHTHIINSRFLYRENMMRQLIAELSVSVFETETLVYFLAGNSQITPTDCLLTESIIGVVRAIDNTQVAANKMIEIQGTHSLQGDNNYYDISNFVHLLRCRKSAYRTQLLSASRKALELLFQDYSSKTRPTYKFLNSTLGYYSDRICYSSLNKPTKSNLLYYFEFNAMILMNQFSLHHMKLVCQLAECCKMHGKDAVLNDDYVVEFYADLMIEYFDYITIASRYTRNRSIKAVDLMEVSDHYSISNVRKMECLGHRITFFCQQIKSHNFSNPVTNENQERITLVDSLPHPFNL